MRVNQMSAGRQAFMIYKINVKYRIILMNYNDVQV